MNSEKFLKAAETYYSGYDGRKSIGTYFEKTLHGILKHCYEPDGQYHEIPFLGYVTDIKNNDGVTEIQTSAFYRLKDKLDIFLPECKVTVVYPIPALKWLIWLDEETGEASKKRKSPKTGSIYDAVRELYTIRNYIGHPNFELRLVFFDMEEYRRLNGWSHDKKRGSTRAERFPVGFSHEVVFSSSEDYMRFLPDSLPEHFTVVDFAKCCSRNNKTSYMTINLLKILGLVKQHSKIRNAFVYEVTSKAESQTKCVGSNSV
ncbi:MAG: hypothetical protein PHY15_08370 [Eubacteriales bacterium]|nr:hypothetical protein [Eubacteriales bacterium]MDD4476033.1 hypothetical protein [Eubacteriales bacterium]